MEFDTLVKKSRIVAAALILLLLSACNPPAEFKGTHVAAIDTSESSRDQIGYYQAAVRDTGMSASLESNFIIYRFDSSPAEIHSGKPPQTLEEATHIVNKVVGRQSDTDGTNLAKLFSVIDKRLPSLPQPVRLVVYTDCGIENMTPEEKAQVTQTVAKWKDENLLESLTFAGLRDEFKLQIREIIDQSEPFFQIKEVGH